MMVTERTTRSQRSYGYGLRYPVPIATVLSALFLFVMADSGGFTKAYGERPPAHPAVRLQIRAAASIDLSTSGSVDRSIEEPARISEHSKTSRTFMNIQDGRQFRAVPVPAQPPDSHTTGVRDDQPSNQRTAPHRPASASTV